MTLAINSKQLDVVSLPTTDIISLSSDIGTLSVEYAKYKETKEKIEKSGKLELSSNVGDIGFAPDFSYNQLRNPIQDQYPLLTWLLNTPMSTQMRNASRRGLAAIHKDATTGEWMIMGPYQVGTEEPIDTSGECCWVPLNITKCGSMVPIRLLCLKDCDNILDNFINANRIGGPTDLTGYFLRPGETVRAARDRMARMSMAFFTAHNVILGVTTAGTDVLKPFHGLLEVMEDPSVINIVGTNPLSAFDSLMCRLNVLSVTGSNYVIAAHPLTIQGISSVVQLGKLGKYPDGWSKTDSGELRFNNIRFIADKMIPVDLTAGTGEAWVIDGDTTGAFLGTGLMPADSFVRQDFTSTNDPEQGCASECTFYYNYGAVMNTNSNRLALITDIPLSANCLGLALQGLDALIKPNTLVPMT